MTTSTKPDVSAFVMMPFAAEFDDVYAAIRQAVAEVDPQIVTVRLDEVMTAGSITEDMVRRIRSATLCIADVTGANPNVMWEVGYAAALGKPTLALNQQGSRLPFDIKDVRTLTYDRTSITKTLTGALTKAVRETLARYTGERPDISPVQQTKNFRALAITGSAGSPHDRVKAELDRLLRPYLGKGYHWYVGSDGAADEGALAYLIAAGEDSIAVVGYNAYDLSGAQLAALQRNPGVTFIDASQEQLPRVPGAPTERDVLFVSRADLMIVLWNGANGATAQLLNWLGDQRKDHLIGFVPTNR